MTVEEIPESGTPTPQIEVGLWEATAEDSFPIEQFADAVLRDDYFFRKGHWLSLICDSRVKVLIVRVRMDAQPRWSEICGVCVLYADSVLHNLFLARQWRGLGVGTLVIDAIQPESIRAKTDMTSGDPTGFYTRLGYTHEAAQKGRRRNIKVLQKPAKQ